MKEAWQAFKALILFRRYTFLPRALEHLASITMWAALILLVLALTNNVPPWLEHQSSKPMGFGISYE